MFTKIIDILTVITMLIVLTVFILQLTPVYKAAFGIFNASAYGF